MEEPYLLKYRNSEVETFTQGTERISLRPVKVSASEPSPISRYSKSSRMTKFSLLEFLGMKHLFPLVAIVVVFWRHSETSLIQKLIPPIDAP